MLPVHSQIDRLETTPLVSIDDARAWVGLYGDTSLDDELLACLKAAIESISNWLGMAIINAKVTDWYPENCRKFRPSQMGVSRDSSTSMIPVVTLSYYDGNNDIVVIDPADFSYDPTTENLEFVLNSGFIAANGISHEYAYPWKLEYVNDISHLIGHVYEGSINMAVRILTSRYWTYRGGIDPNPNATDRAVSNILGPAKTIDWYVRMQGVD